MDGGARRGRYVGIGRRSPLKTVLCATTAIATVLQPMAAKAQPAPARAVVAGTADARAFAIPAGPLALALNRFADVAQLQLVYSGTVTQGLSTSGLNGTYTRQEALERLLIGSGLVYRFTSPTTATIERPGGAEIIGDSPEGTLELDTINVSNVFRPPWSLDANLPFETPSAVSVVTSEVLGRVPANHASDLLETVPGAWAAGSTNDPGISVNIRGAQDFGRVNVMVDGVRQNFQYGGHGTNGTAYFDPALIGGIEVQRGPISTVHGAGTLVGAVNFRTIEIDDVLREDQTWGARATGIYGTNNYNGSGVLSGGARISENWDVFGAFSMRQSGDYKDGAGDVVPSAQDLKSGLVKTNLRLFDDHYLKFGVIVYDNIFDMASLMQEMHTTVQTGTVGYAWTPNDNWIDLRANGYVSRTEMKVADGFLTLANVDYEDTTFGGDISNTSRFSWGPVDAKIVYGGEFQYDKVSSSDVGGDGNFGTLTPSGDRSIGGLFSETTLTYGMFDLIGGLRFDSYRLTGSGVNTQAPGFILPPGPFEVDNTANHVSPKFTLAVNPLDWMQVYGTWGESFRPPAVTETLMSGQHPGGLPGSFSPNPFLVPETSNGWEIGVNVKYNGLFRVDDALRLKADYFSTNVSDYIASLQCTAPPYCSMSDPINYFENLAGETKLEGFELEATYDVGFGFVNATYSRVETTYPTDALPAGAPAGTALSSQPPETFVFGAGVRLLEDRRLTLGGRVKIVPTQTYTVTADGFFGKETFAGYQVYDVFGSYEASDTMRAFFSVENIGNELYSSTISTALDNAPGLTAKFGLTVTLAN